MDITVLKILMTCTYPLATRVQYVLVCYSLLLLLLSSLITYLFIDLFTTYTYTYNALEARIELTRQYRIGQKEGDER